MRNDSGEPSKPERLASTTSGREPLVALMARAIFFDDIGNSVPEVHEPGPSAGTGPWRTRGRDSMPTMVTGQPPRWASHTTAVSASRMAAHRSIVRWSWSTTDAITVRMSKGFLRSGLLATENTSPTVAKSEPSIRCGKSRTSRSVGSVVAARRGNRSPGAT